MNVTVKCRPAEGGTENGSNGRLFERLCWGTGNQGREETENTDLRICDMLMEKAFIREKKSSQLY